VTSDLVGDHVIPAAVERLPKCQNQAASTLRPSWSTFSPCLWSSGSTTKRSARRFFRIELV